MSQVNLLFKIESYNDESDVVVPVLKEFDWTRQIQAITSSKVDVITRSCATGTTNIALPDTTISLLYIESNGSISVRLNGDTGNTNLLTPSVAGEMDAVFFKRGAVTSLVIYNAAATSVSVKIFLGV